MKQPLHVLLWSNADLRLVLPARAVSYAGDSIALVALMLRVSTDGGPAAVTALLLAFALPTVAMIPLAGRIADGCDSRQVLVSTSLLQGAAVIGLAFSDGLPATLALVCLLQAGQAVAGPAWGALIPRIVGAALVGRTIGTSQALIGVATLTGSAVGGLLVGWAGHRTALLVDAATFFALAVVGRLVRTRRRPEPGVVRQPRALLSGLHSLLTDTLLRVLIPALWIFVLIAEAANVVEVFLVTNEVGLGARGYGVVLAVQGGGAIVGAWLTGRLSDDRSRARAAVAGTAGIGLACVLMGLADGVVLLLAGAWVVGGGGGMLNAAISTLVVTRSADAVRGRVIAALSGTTRACSLLALPVGGLAGSTIGPRATFVAGGCGGAVTAVVTAVVLRRIFSVPVVADGR